MAFFLAAVGALSAIVLVLVGLGLARRLAGLTRSVSALQADLVPALKEIERDARKTQQLAASLEERARSLRPDRR